MPTQQAIQRWFNRTYSQRGLSYLRPPEFYSVFMEYLGVTRGDRVLDVGCGPGLLLQQALERGAFALGVDLSESALAMVPEQAPGAHVSLCSGEALCWPNSFFDYVTCIGVFEHFLQPNRALDEMRRVTKPGGRICIMAPNSRTLKWQMESKVFRIHDEDSNEQASTLEAWRQVFLENGLTIERIYPDQWPAYVRRRRFFRSGAGSFATFGARTRRFPPLRFANQFVFILRP
jgi:SAM-dependent methyltransferase